VKLRARIEALEADVVPPPAAEPTWNVDNAALIRDLDALGREDELPLREQIEITKRRLNQTRACLEARRHKSEFEIALWRRPGEESRLEALAEKLAQLEAALAAQEACK